MGQDPCSVHSDLQNNAAEDDQQAVFWLIASSMSTLCILLPPICDVALQGEEVFFLSHHDSRYCFKLEIQMNLLTLFLHSSNICGMPVLCQEQLHIPAQIQVIVLLDLFSFLLTMWLPALLSFQSSGTPVGCQSWDFSLRLPHFILGDKREYRVSGTIDGCSLGQLKEVRKQVDQLFAKRAPKTGLGSDGSCEGGL